ncbi:MAG: metal ABC transporter solute-binding protein, Zn/Mn family [Thiolinea sp.]
MKFFTRRHLRAALLFLLLTSAPFSHAEEVKVKAIATFSILGDMVKAIGGDRVQVKTLVGPDSDAHVYSPTPADAKDILAADVLFVNGFEFEGWLDRLIDASGYKGRIITATKGIDGLAFAHEDEGRDDKHEDSHKDKHDNKHEEGHKDARNDEHKEQHEDGHDDEHKDEHGHHHGEIDPHAWHSLTHAKTYIKNIHQALQDVDPAGTATYTANHDAYLTELGELEQLVTETLDTLPEGRRTVVTSHDAFGYFADAYNLRFLAPQGMNTETEASAKDVATLIERIRSENITALFLENMVSSRLLEQIAAESHVEIGGKLYSDALSQPDAEAGTYLKMMRHNIQTLYQTLKED